MTVKTFFFGLAASFGLPWLVMLAVPFGTMRSLEEPQYDEVNDERTDKYQSLRAGSLETGSQIYRQEGCMTCHTQVTRPTTAGNDVFREGQGGFRNDEERGDTRRITNPWDFAGEFVAPVGESRIGPDLGNFGNRLDIIALEVNEKKALAMGISLIKEDKSPMTPQDVANALGDKAFDKEAYVYKHLYNPRIEGFEDKGRENEWSVCQANPQFFTKVGNFGQGAKYVVDVKCDQQLVPTGDCKALVNYLINLKKDNAVPYAMQYAQNKQKGAK